MTLETNISPRVHFYYRCRIRFLLYPSKDFVSLCEHSSFVAFIVNCAFMTEPSNAKKLMLLFDECSSPSVLFLCSLPFLDFCPNNLNETLIAISK